MRLTTKGRFAVTAMLDLALHDGSGPVTLAGISRRQSISLSYLEQLFGKLRRRSLVDSVRGPGGGYTLARASNTITVADIIRAVDETLDATQCRIAAWVDAEKRSARGTLASIQAIETLHRQLHGLAAEILESQADGRNPDGLARLEQLHFLHDECLSRLRRFTRLGRGNGGKRNGVAPPQRSRAKQDY